MKKHPAKGRKVKSRKALTSQSWRCDWVSKKCEIASALAQGEAGGSYGEAVIIVCTALNALAAEVWPGRGHDRKRFIELLVRLGSSPNLLMTISTPLLVRHLATTSPPQDSATLLKNALLDFSPTRVVTGSEVDKMENDLKFISPVLKTKTIRKFSYACLLYEEVRTSYAHEYKPGDKADSMSMSRYEGQPVSYVNRLLAAGVAETGRLIHFNITWLTRLAVDIARSIDAPGTVLPGQEPDIWWIDGSPL